MSHPQSKRAKADKKKRADRRRQRDPEQLAERAERRAALKESRELAELGARRKHKRKKAAMGAAALALTGLFGFAVWTQIRPGPELAGVVRPPDDGRGHANGISYPSLTPTSGTHSRQAPVCADYPAQLDASLAVHALEHGVVVLWYDAARPELGSALADVAAGWDSHVIVSPHASLDEPVIATAWNRLKVYPDVVPEVAEFIDTYRRRGPERVACDRI